MSSQDLKQRMYPNTARVLNRLIIAPAKTSELARVLHLGVSSVENSTALLHEWGVIHIWKYDRSKRGTPATIWKAGAGEDAVLVSQPLTAAVKSAAWRARGGDQHKARTLQRNGKRIAAGMTLAGMAGVKQGNVEVTGLAAASLPQGPCGLPGSTPATNRGTP